MPARAKLTDAEVRRIRRLVLAGRHQSDLAREFGVSRKTIRRRPDAFERTESERAQRAEPGLAEVTEVARKPEPWEAAERAEHWLGRGRSRPSLRFAERLLRPEHARAELVGVAVPLREAAGAGEHRLQQSGHAGENLAVRRGRSISRSSARACSELAGNKPGGRGR